MLFPGPPSAGLLSHLQLQAAPLLMGLCLTSPGAAAIPAQSLALTLLGNAGRGAPPKSSKAVVLVVFKLHASAFTHIFKINLKGFLKPAVKLT